MILFHNIWRAPEMSFRGILFSRVGGGGGGGGCNIATVTIFLCQKLDDGSASMMPRRHLISDINYTADQTYWTHHPRIYNHTETQSGELDKSSETPCFAHPYTRVRAPLTQTPTRVHNTVHIQLFILWQKQT